MGVLGEGVAVLFSTQNTIATVASTGTIVAKITAAQFAAVSPSAAVNYHVTFTPGSQSTGAFALLQATSTTVLDRTAATCRNSMQVLTLAGQSWNYDFYCRIEVNDCLTVHMPNSSGATGVDVKLFAEPLV